jgi:hypothetical protein
MSKEKRKGILLNLKKERYDLIAKTAKEKRRTVTSIIEEAIDKYFSKPGKGKPSLFNVDTSLDIDKETNIWQ